MEEKIFDNDYFTLTDEDGNEIEFELIGRCERNGKQYFAMIPVEEGEKESDVYEYVVLKLDTVDGEEMLVTIDDDEELDDIADYFDDLFSQEIDYDN
ncbi:MAG: DUF1292 domain-containing protein [Clostridia bacterium]|nr:DUF1292 domain-containing protein [Clostridia bacterium]